MQEAKYALYYSHVTLDSNYISGGYFWPLEYSQKVKLYLNCKCIMKLFLSHFRCRGNPFNDEPNRKRESFSSLLQFPVLCFFFVSPLGNVWNVDAQWPGGYVILWWLCCWSNWRKFEQSERILRCVDLQMRF